MTRNKPAVTNEEFRAFRTDCCVRCSFYCEFGERGCFIVRFSRVAIWPVAAEAWQQQRVFASDDRRGAVD